jgi:hypothetical protein
MPTAAACRRPASAACAAWAPTALDLYLLHWRGNVPLAETLEAFERLREQGKIRDFGVSNFDLDDMLEAAALPGGERRGDQPGAVQPGQRGIEWDLLPWCRERRMPLMAYSPLESNAAEQAGCWATRSWRGWRGGTAHAGAGGAGLAAAPGRGGGDSEGGAAAARAREPRRARHRADAGGPGPARRRLSRAAPAPAAGDALGS